MTRYEIRNTAYAIRNGKTPKFPEVVEKLQPLLDEKGFKWVDFPEYWDVVVVGKELKVITAIRNLSEVEMVCAQKQMAEKVGADPQFDDRSLAIVESIEAQFLDDIMSWENYRDEWSVRKDEQGRIVTKLLKRKPAQKLEITQEVIDQKIKESLAQSSGSADTKEARENVTPHVHVTKVLE
jgi:hypothetical protein